MKPSLRTSHSALEQAKIEEARDTPTVRILDRATPPLYRTRPKNKLNMAVGLVLGMALALIAVLGLDRMAPSTGTEGERWRALIASACATDGSARRRCGSTSVANHAST